MKYQKMSRPYTAICQSPYPALKPSRAPSSSFLKYKKKKCLKFFVCWEFFQSVSLVPPLFFFSLDRRKRTYHLNLTALVVLRSFLFFFLRQRRKSTWLDNIWKDRSRRPIFPKKKKKWNLEYGVEIVNHLWLSRFSCWKNVMVSIVWERKCRRYAWLNSVSCFGPMC